MCWTFWRFSAWMSQITCPILCLQHDSRNFFPLASHFMTFLLGMRRNQTLKLKKRPTSLQVLLIFCSFTFSFTYFFAAVIHLLLGFLPVQTFLWKHLCHMQRVATALCVVTSCDFFTQIDSYKLLQSLTWLSLTFRFAVIKYQKPSRQTISCLLTHVDRGVTRIFIKQKYLFLRNSNNTFATYSENQKDTITMS